MQEGGKGGEVGFLVRILMDTEIDAIETEWASSRSGSYESMFIKVKNKTGKD